MPEAAPETEAAPEPEELHYCPACGAMLENENDFCPICGWSGEYVEEEKPAEAAAPAPAMEDSGDEAPDDFEAD